MSSLFLLFLLLLFLAAAFFAYLVHFLRHRYEEEHSSSAAKDNNPNDLREMARLLENDRSKSAKLVIEQLSSRKASGKDSADILSLRMRAYLKLGEVHNALHCALQLAQLGGKSRFISSIEFIEHLASIYAILGHNEKAYNEYALLMQKQPNNVEYIWGAASQALEMKQYETAVTLFDKVLKQRPDHSPSLCKIGRIYCEKKLYPQALEYLNRAYSRNYDSNELRYYLALTLIQISGNDAAAFSLLQQVIKDREWSKKALPRIAKLADKLKDYPNVVEAINKYRVLYERESSENLLNELTMLQAKAHRGLHELDKACALWEKMSETSIYHTEAHDNLAIFRCFCEEGVFYDYIQSLPSEFLALCTKVCDFTLKRQNPKEQFTLTGQMLKIENHNNGTLSTQSSAFPGVIIQQHMADHRKPGSGKPGRSAPNFYIFLRLDQYFNNADLQLNLKNAGIDQDFNRIVNVHVYSFHHISSATFSHSSQYSLHFHKSEELQQILESFELHSTTAEQKTAKSAAPLSETGNDDTPETRQQARQVARDAATGFTSFVPGTVDETNATETLQNAQTSDLLKQLGEAKRGLQKAQNEAKS